MANNVPQFGLHAYPNFFVELAGIVKTNGLMNPWIHHDHRGTFQLQKPVDQNVLLLTDDTHFDKLN